MQSAGSRRREVLGRGLRIGAARYLLALLVAGLAAQSAFAQANETLDDAAALAATPPLFDKPDAVAAFPVGEPRPAVEVGEAPVNLLIAAHKTTTRRYSNSYLTSGKPRRRPLAVSMRLRRQDDANFTNRTKYLAARIEAVPSTDPPELAIATTGEEFLGALIGASRRGPIGNLVVYGHAAPNAVFMREDLGFYTSVDEIARSSRIVDGTEEERIYRLRAEGTRDLGDLMELVATGEIRFAKNAVVVFAGCGVAGKRDIDLGGIGARVADIADAAVIASIDVTDQSMGHGRSFRDREYSRRTWVRFTPRQPPERLNTRVIDALKQLNLNVDAIASTPETPGAGAN